MQAMFRNCLVSPRQGGNRMTLINVIKVLSWSFMFIDKDLSVICWSNWRSHQNHNWNKIEKKINKIDLLKASLMSWVNNWLKNETKTDWVYWFTQGICVYLMILNIDFKLTTLRYYFGYIQEQLRSVTRLHLTGFLLSSDSLLSFFWDIFRFYNQSKSFGIHGLN